MNHLTPEIFTTTRPLSNQDRLDVWKEKKNPRREVTDQRSAPARHRLTLPFPAMAQARSALPLD